MEIKSEKKTLPANCFKGLNGVVDVPFQPRAGEVYICIKECEVGGVVISEGKKLKLTIKNKKHSFYDVS